MTYEEWIALSETSYKLVSPSYIRGVMDACGCYEFAMDLTTESARAFQDEMNSGAGFNFNPDNPVGAYVRSIVEGWITKYADTYPLGEDSETGLSYGERFQSAYDDILDYALVTTYPNEGKSLLQYNQFYGLYTPLSVSNSSTVYLSVSGCEERCCAAVYGVSENLDEPVNLGCPAYGKDKFMFAGIKNTHLYDSLEIRIPFEGVEVI